MYDHYIHAVTLFLRNIGCYDCLFTAPSRLQFDVCMNDVLKYLNSDLDEESDDDDDAS